jgi:hypothetical protein
MEGGEGEDEGGGKGGRKMKWEGEDRGTRGGDGERRLLHNCGQLSCLW